MSEKTGSLLEWIIPAGFFVSCGWVVWHLPAYILSFLPHADQSVFDRVKALHETKDVSPNLPAILGDFTDPLDWLFLILIPVLFVIGIRTVRVYSMEYQDWRAVDRVAIFIGRVTMVMIIAMTAVMLYEVFLRYVLEKPTRWANELTLWIGGFVFLCSGFYAMQQRSHIRIFLLYDVVPRNVQRLFDVISATLICLFAFGLIFGSYQQVFVVKFYRWEMFGTAFDPPIPATIQPMILIVITLVAIQSVLNVISDWNKDPGQHSAADDIDQDELEAIKKSVGAD